MSNTNSTRTDLKGSVSNFRTNLFISDKLVANNQAKFKEFEAKLNELNAIAKEISPNEGATLLIGFLNRNSEYNPKTFEHFLSNVFYVQRAYNMDTISSTPEMANELGSLTEHRMAFNNIADKRRTKRIKAMKEIQRNRESKKAEKQPTPKESANTKPEPAQDLGQLPLD